LIELVWTITPALVLIAIAFPSFKLLYLMDWQQYDISKIAAVIHLAPLTHNLLCEGQWS
jgi:heme/copper-type cytochrome/quinol oxidase subunit 2